MNRHEDIISEVEIERDTTDMLLGNSFVGLLMTIFAFSGLVFFFENDEPSIFTHKLQVWIAMMSISIARLLDSLYWRANLAGKLFNPRPALIRFSVGLYITGTIWALYSILFYSSMATVELAATMVVLSAMAGGAGTVLSPNKKLVSFYSTALLVPMSLCAVTDEEGKFFILGVLGLVFWFGIFTSAFRYNKFFINTLHLKARNNSLVEQMKTERSETEKINQLLIASNEKLDASNATLEAEVERRTADLYKLSNRDPLTNLLNRNGFLKYLNNLLDTTRALDNSLALLFIDLDGFKQVNDSLGHKIGDIVLAEIANRLRNYTEENHLGRWGGDEFVAVIPYANVDTAKAVAHAMRSGVTVPIIANDNQVTLDATIGIAMFPEHGETAVDLIQQADLTMYDQKREQRGSIGVFSQALHQEIKREQQLCERLRCAIDNCEFTVFYQPIIDVASNTLSSVEALLRWKCDDESISPAVFIPLAERSGLMPEIGAWVLNRALIDLSHWQFKQNLAISINVSVSQLLDDSFLKTVDNALKTTQISSARLHLEITESVFASDKEVVSVKVNELVAQGIKVSIDDFGTGYSSLNRLQSMPCDFIKIDRSFVQNSSEESDTIIRATLLMAKEFGCKTIAEGIETEEQKLHLAQLGTDYLQGFYFAKPMNAGDLISWYNENY
ncbi:putative bifunctional diguanylate cyclase/phosphodiesterase [Alteromonas macleodii]|uniref:Diguanylate cyclase n=1 Tax=Alteromonas macleodii TaxID=28108 RepID=A0A6T9Y2A0_ALTMA|nr:bifunctional diguanylate cyclase/phosphodiesterase [Alteromonas macleodii]CAB9494834.1 Diguanylate cyclase [Alteromonas macleodii]